MGTLRLYYVTNRKHQGKNRWRPESYGKSFSDDGAEDLRFGKVTVKADDQQMKKWLNFPVGTARGEGEKLAEHFSKCVQSARITAFQEKIDPKAADHHESGSQLGSHAMFAELRDAMMQSTDVLVYIHGSGVGWSQAVGSALALQEMLNHTEGRNEERRVLVVLFTWPADEPALPFLAYKSGKAEACASGFAAGRAIVKLRDYLASQVERAKKGEQVCDRDIHLLCHAMGNYVLQNAVASMVQLVPGRVLPRLFEHVFLCAADLDDTALESGQAMGQIHELARHVSVYHNHGDIALHVSDYTKGNPERLGMGGSAHPSVLHTKIHQIDCTQIVRGLVEHRYYLSGLVNADIRYSLDGMEHNDPHRRRFRNPAVPNVWTMK